MKYIKKLFSYKNKIILTNGSSFKISSTKYIKNNQLNHDLFKKNVKNINLNQLSNKKSSDFFKEIKKHN